MRKSYRIIKEEKLYVVERSKLFVENTEYFWDIFIKVYTDKFEIYNVDDIPPIEIIIDGGGAEIDRDYLIDFREIYNKETPSE